MSDCIYIMTQEELNRAEKDFQFVVNLTESIAEFNKAISELAEALLKTVVPTCEEILRDLANTLLSFADASGDVCKLRPKLKRPQRNLFFRYEHILDKRLQIQQRRKNKCP